MTAQERELMRSFRRALTVAVRLTWSAGLAAGQSNASTAIKPQKPSTRLWLTRQH